MKQLYSRFFSVTILILFQIALSQFSYGQCPNGEIPGATAFDTTISFPTGTTSIPVKFPKFDPQNGMVTCVRLCVTITGIIDTLAMQNFAASGQTGTYNYIRNDQISGPGLITPLSNSVNLSYGPYPLTAYDGIPGAGTDFFSMGDSTILSEQLCRTVSDSATIAQFYGSDSVTYNYDIDVTSSATISGGSNSVLVLTSAFVNFHFQYCTCPSAILPLNIRQFTATKLTDTKAELKWTGFDDPYSNYHYEVEVSRDGHHFTTVSSFPKNTGSTNPYRYIYTATDGESGVYYFRIKQVYSNGYTRFSSIRQVSLENSDFPKFTLYPNPSDGIVGIKFDNITTGQFNIQIYNTQGQMMVTKDIVTNGASYLQLATLKSGVYWLRVTEAKSQTSCVNQLLIK
jgi:hypothetical protein